MPAAAIGGVVGIGGSLIAADKQKDAMKDATQATTQANQHALDLQREMYEQTRQDFLPYNQFGQAAMNPLAAMLGMDMGGAPVAANSNGQTYNAQPFDQWGAYLQQYPDVRQAWDENRHGVQQMFGSPTQFAQWHHTEHGVGAGRTVPTAPSSYAKGGEFVDPGATTNPVGGVEAQGQNALTDGLFGVPQVEMIDSQGVQPGELNFDLEALQNTPGYQFALGQGIEAIESSAASKGLLKSGPTAKAIQGYGTDLANQYFNQERNFLVGERDLQLNTDFANRGFQQSERNIALDQQNYNRQQQLNALFNALNVGSGAAANTSAAGTNYANAASSAYSNMGNAAAQGAIGKANAFTNMIGGVTNSAMNAFGSVDWGNAFGGGMYGGVGSDRLAG